ncbi:MAG: DUF1194 domain-containing protein [Microvirga sp.]
MTVNGIVLGHDPDLVAYFQPTGAGGPGSFVAHVSAAETMADVIRRKFLKDIVIGFVDDPGP